MATTIDRDDLLPTLAAARIIGISPDGLRWMRRSGRIEAHRLPGGQYVFPRDACEAEAKRRKRQTARERLGR